MPDVQKQHSEPGVLVGTIITCLNGAPRVQRKNGLDALDRLVEQLETLRASAAALNGAMVQWHRDNAMPNEFIDYHLDLTATLRDSFPATNPLAIPRIEEYHKGSIEDTVHWDEHGQMQRGPVPDPASVPLCECGHSEERHLGDSLNVARTPCQATVYTEAPLGGGNAFTCHCRDYVPASEPKA